MARAPNWTPEEFETLLQSPGLNDQQVAERLERRSVDAVAVVREGIHAHHRRMNDSMLSEMMRRRLGDTERRVRCPRCGLDVLLPLS